MQVKRTVALVAGLAVLVLAGCGSAASGLTNDQIREQVGRLSDESDGTNLTLVDVPWCVEGISDNEWECRVHEKNHSTGDVWELTIWATCDETTCTLEPDR
jgi:hypothetical protein